VKKFLAVVFVLFMVFVLMHRQRLFLRDPLGKVERNGVKVDGAKVFINFSNDILVEEPGASYRYMVQGWDKKPGAPKSLKCLSGMACMTEADRADMVPLGGTDYQPQVRMSNREVTFTDTTGGAVRVALR
jgi:hypothetical protein